MTGKRGTKMRARPSPDLSALDDLALAGRIAARDRDAFRLVMQRNNQRLFRAAWSILKNRTEAEDAVQSAYLLAFDRISSFEGRASLSTWLTRIAINEALGRARAAKRRRAALEAQSVVLLDERRERLAAASAEPTAPDGALARVQIRRMLEEAIARLPESFRLVFVLREIEGLNVQETADTLGIAAATVKTRHLRARRRLQAELAPELRSALSGTFPFAGADCRRMTQRVLGLHFPVQAA
jgi:RNA polymerase sigma-70 factor (ECF subfamily)